MAGKVELPDTTQTSSKMFIHSVLMPKDWTAEEIADGTAAADDTLRIQTAIDNAARSVSGEELAIVKLKAGDYYVADVKSNGNVLRLKSNVILSGEGQGPTGTIIHATGKRSLNKDGKQQNYIVFRLSGSNPSTVGTAVKISSDYIPAGSKAFDVADASQFKEGDLIRIHHPSTAEWDKYMETST